MAESTCETAVLDLLADVTADSVAASNLDPDTLMLLRLAALVAVEAPSSSYQMSLEAASELDIDPERPRDVLAALAPTVTTLRVVSATGKIVEALTLEVEEQARRQKVRKAIVANQVRSAKRSDRCEANASPTATTADGVMRCHGGTLWPL